MREKRKWDRYIHWRTYTHWRTGGFLALLVVLIFGAVGGLIFGIPGITPGLASQQASNKPIDVTVYITQDTLSEIFQDRVNQMLGSAVDGSVGNLPAQSRSQALQLANALLQPSAVLSSVVPQQNALTTDLQLSLYPDDPHPINAQMQISFRIVSASTMQVNVTPLPGSPVLANGPVASIQMPLGELSSVQTTPSCGSTALAIHLQFPLSLSSSSTAPTTPQATATPDATGQAQSSAVSMAIGIPSSSLDAIGQSVGSMPISAAMSASNIHIAIQNGTLNITSDLYMGGINIGSTTTTVSTSAANGNLVMHILNTSVQFLHTFPFPYNMYNQQLQTTLNSKMQAAFAGKLSITQATLGSSTQVSCAPSDGLLLTGSASLG